jgi:hypothetical protein
VIKVSCFLGIVISGLVNVPGVVGSGVVDGFDREGVWSKMAYQGKKWPGNSRLEVTAEGTRDGKKCLRITSLGLAKGGRLDIEARSPVAMPGRPVGVGLWVKSNITACFSVCVADAKGEAFGQFAFYEKPNEWQFLDFKLGSGPHWSGNNDGIIDYPVNVMNIGLQPDEQYSRPYVQIQYDSLTALEGDGEKVSAPKAESKMVVTEKKAPSYSAQRRSAAVKIDGDLSEWNGAAAMVLDRKSQVVDPEWKGPNDLSAKIFLQWDHENLYLAAEVTDNHLCFSPDALTMWMYDSLQLVFDTGGNRGGWNSGDYCYSLGLVRDAGEFMALKVAGSENRLTSVLYRQDKTGIRPRGPVASAHLAGRTTENGYILEAAIPWTELSPLVPIDKKGGLFDIIINDNDGSGRKGWIGWTPGIGEDAGTEKFGDLTFAGKSELELFASMPKNIFQDNEEVSVRFQINAPREIKETGFSWSVLSPEGKKLLERQERITLVSGLNTFERKWNTTDQPRGEYRVFGVLNAIGTKTAAAFQKESKLALTKRAAALREQLKRLNVLLLDAEKKRINTQYQRVSYYAIQQTCDYVDFIAGPDRNRPDVAERMLGYSEGLEQRASEEVKGLMADPASARPVVPGLDLARKFSLKDGIIYNGDIPVILVGLIVDGRNEFVMDVMEKMPKLGFNFYVLQEPVGPSRICDAEGKVNRGNLKMIQKKLDQARKNNLAVDLHFGDHYYEGAFKKVFPDVYEPDGCKGFHFYYNGCLENPHYREILKRWLNILVPTVKDHPALFSYCIGNESLFACSCPRRMDLFRQWLMAKYGSLAKVNATWNSGLTSLEQIPGAYRTNFGGNEFGTAVFDPFFQNHPAAMYDYTVFNQERFYDWFRYFQDTVRTMDKKTYTHIKHMMIGIPFTEHQYVGCGLDRERAAELTDFNGNDGGPLYVYFPDLAGKRIEKAYRCALFFDLLKSINPGKPILNSENLCTDYNYQFVPPENYRLAIWDEVLHGQAATLVWQWADQLPWAWKSQYDCRPEMMDALGRASLDIRRLTPQIVKFWQAPREVAILYSKSSLAWSDMTENSIYEWYLTLTCLDAPVGFVTEKQITEGKLKDFKLLIIPKTNYVPEEVYRGIREFAKRGGKVVMSPPSLEFDEHGKKRVGNIPGMAVDEPGVEKAPKYDRIFDLANIRRPVRVGNYQVEARTVEAGSGKWVMYVMNRSNTAQEIKLKGDKKIGKVRELISGKEVGLSFKIGPAVVMLLEIDSENH